MANLPESSTFDAGVYQIETTDPVVGGASGVTNTPLKNLANRTKYLKDHVDAIEAAYAPKASPSFTGNPTAPTQAVGDTSTKLATTEFVANKVAAAAPDLSGYAPKASPTFTGNPNAPTAPQFDADTSIATTEFVQRALGNFRGAVQYNNQTLSLSASDVGRVVICGGGGSELTLPAVSSCPVGSAFHFFSQGGLTNVYAASGNRIAIGNATSEPKVSIVGNEFFTIENNGGDSWCVVSGTPMFRNTGIFGASIGSSGYQKLPSGLIMQWGQVISGAAGSVSVVFPITFPNACLLALPTCGERGSFNTADIFAPGAKTVSGAVFYGSTDADTAASMIFNYIALGY